MQAIITENNEIVGQMELQTEMLLIDVAYEIYNSLPIDPSRSIGAQPMLVSFYIHDDFPAATVVVPNDIMFDQFKGPRIQDLSTLYQIATGKISSPQDTVEIKIEPLTVGLNFFSQYLKHPSFSPSIPHIPIPFQIPPSESQTQEVIPQHLVFPTPFQVPKSPTRISAPSSQGLTHLPPVPSLQGSGFLPPLSTPSPPVSPSRIPLFGTQQVTRHRWIVTQDRSGQFRLLDENKVDKRPRSNKKIKLGTRFPGYSRDTYVNIIQDYIKAHPSETERIHRYNRVILSGNKENLFEIIKEIVPIRYVDV